MQNRITSRLLSRNCGAGQRGSGRGEGTYGRVLQLFVFIVDVVPVVKGRHPVVVVVVVVVVGCRRESVGGHPNETRSRRHVTAMALAPALRHIPAAALAALPLPTQKIHTEEDVETWKGTMGYSDYLLFLGILNEAVVGVQLPYTPPAEIEVRALPRPRAME